MRGEKKKRKKERKNGISVRKVNSITQKIFYYLKKNGKLATNKQSDGKAKKIIQRQKDAMN